MLNFSVGPVQSEDYVCKIGGEQVPYFRTKEFSEVMFENERLMKAFVFAPSDSRTVFITGGGSASMEASIINTLTKNDKAIVVNGGSFGQRFKDMLDLHGIPNEEIKLDYGKELTEKELLPFENGGFTSFLVNIGETSTGVHYDTELISEFCKRNDLFLIVDAISSFLADPLDMTKTGADVVITGSQKALACAPGISICVLSPKAIERVNKTKCPCMYLDFASHLKNGERGQTPFTPAVSVLLQINSRLRKIESDGGAEYEIKRTKDRAEYFRKKIISFPFDFFTKSPSNAVTSLTPKNVSAYEIFTCLKDNYGIWVCPNGGELKDKVLRVGHIGSLTYCDYDALFSALSDMSKKGLL